MPYIAPHIPQRVLRKRGVIVAAPFAKIKQRPEQFEIDYDHPLAKGLVFAGLGNKPGSVRYNDSSVYGNTGTLTGMTPASDWVNELNRFALSFGTSKYIQSINDNVVNVSPITVAAWIYRSGALANYNGIANSLNASNGERGWGLFGNVTTNAVHFDSNGTGGWKASPKTVLPISEWHHIVGSHVEGSNELVFDGVSAGVSTGASLTYDAARKLKIGVYSVTSPSSNTYWPGKLADVMVWSRRLSNDEKSKLADPSNVMLSGLIKPVQGTTKYFRGVTLSDAYTLKPPAVHVSHGNARPQNFTLDYSHPLAKGLVIAFLGNNPGSVNCFNSAPLNVHGHGTLMNMDPYRDWVWDAYLNRWKLQFGVGSATNHHVITGNSPTNINYTQLSIAIWSYAESAGIGTNYARMIARDNQTPGLFGNSGSYTFVNSGELTFSSRTYNSWNHVVGTWDGNTYRGYVSGKETGSNVSTVTPTVYTLPWYLGNNVSLNRPHDGFLCDGMVWNRVLNPKEILEIADPSNILLSGLIVPQDTTTRILPLPINDRHWVGRSNDWHAAENWSRSQGGRGGAGVPNENTNVFFD